MTENKYGLCVFGSNRYGTDVATPPPVIKGAWQYMLNISWGNGTVNEANYLTNARGHRGRKYLVSRGAERFETIQPGEFTFTLTNLNGRYDPYNTSSPLYGYILPGREVRFRKKNVASGISYDVFTGIISNIEPISGNQDVQITVVDYLQWLADQDITIPTAYNITVSDAISNTLTAANYPYSKLISTSRCPITYFDPADANSLDVVRSLADAGAGTVFVSNSGVFKYYDLSYNSMPTYALDQTILYKEIAIAQPWENVRNKISIVANRWGYSAPTQVWALDGPTALNASSTTTFDIKYDKAFPIQPIAGQDYQAVALFGPGSFTLMNAIDIWLSAITSTTCRVNVRNNMTYGLYLNWLHVKGRLLINSKMSFYAQDDTSIAAYGPRRFKVDSDYMQDTGFADAYKNILLNILKNPSKSPIITLETRAEALQPDLMDKISLTSAKLGINSTFSVGEIDYEWLNSNGQKFKVDLSLTGIAYADTASIVPQPFYPSLPAVPVPGGGNIPGWGEPPAPITDGNSACYATDAPINGPFEFMLQGQTVDNVALDYEIGCDFYVRALGSTNKTYVHLQLRGLSQVGDGPWYGDQAVGVYTMTGVNEAGKTMSFYIVSDGRTNGEGTQIWTGSTAEPAFHCVRLRLTLTGTVAVAGIAYTSALNNLDNAGVTDPGSLIDPAGVLKTYVIGANGDEPVTVDTTGWANGQLIHARGYGYFHYATDPTKLDTIYTVKTAYGSSGSGETSGAYANSYLNDPHLNDGSDVHWPFARFWQTLAIYGNLRNAENWFILQGGCTVQTGTPFGNHGGMTDTMTVVFAPASAAPILARNNRLTIGSCKAFNICQAGK